MYATVHKSFTAWPGNLYVLITLSGKFDVPVLVTDIAKEAGNVAPYIPLVDKETGKEIKDAEGNVKYTIAKREGGQKYYRPIETDTGVKYQLYYYLLMLQLDHYKIKSCFNYLKKYYFRDYAQKRDAHFVQNDHCYSERFMLK